ncbi:DUF2206 domain-containing protein, partial [Patescibacteria group bacterium]|nr:DUF2206 domain-containing protein [Patescibacteria group bacterium]
MIDKKKIFREKREFYATGLLILLLLVFGFLWYAQLTDVSSGLIDFTKKSFSNMGQMFKDDVRADQSFILDQFNIFYKPIEKTPLLLDYINKTEQKKENEIDKYPLNTYKHYQIKVLYSNILPFRLNYSNTKIISLLFEIIKKLIKLFIIIGVLYLLFAKIKDNKFDIEFIAMSLIGLSFLFLITIMPFASISYGLFRAYQQILVILSLSAVFGCVIFFKFLKENLRINVAIIFFILYFLLTIGFIPQI